MRFLTATGCAWITAWLLGCLPQVVAAAQPDWEDGPGHRRIRLNLPASGKSGFTALPLEHTGVRFTNSLPEQRYLENMNLLNGSGVALGDYDGDGRCDIYLCGLDRPSALYRNLGGFRFEDVAPVTGTACEGQTSTGAAFADVNGDGHLDLLVTSMGGPNALFLNDREGHWTNVTATAGLASTLGGTSLALGDVDGNGTLDLYVANYGATSILRSGGGLSIRYVNGRPVVTGRYAKRIRIVGNQLFELGEPDMLYLNDGQGRFTPVSWTGGAFLDEDGQPLLEAPWDQSLSVLMADLNADGFPDLYVCGDASTPDHYWINDGRGRFRALPGPAMRQTPYFSMSVDVADVDADGHDDLFATDMLSRQHVYALTQRGVMHDQPRLPGDSTTRLQARRNMLLRARGDGTYEEFAFYAGVAASEWTWSCLFLDVDLDGWEDLLVSNGFLHNVDDLDTREQIKRMGNLNIGQSRRTFLMFEKLETPNLAFHNRRDLTFLETGREWGFDSPQISNGMAMGDLDGDGDLDVVVNCFGTAALVYRNESIAPRLAVRLRGRAPNTRGIGARVRVLGGPVDQSRQMLAGGRYMGGDQDIRAFGTGSATHLTIEVTWRNGTQTVLRDVAPNYLYEIEQPGNASVPAAKPAHPEPLFRDESASLAHRHAEAPFDDFALQPLLPYRLSQLGPGVAWCDLDQDGHEELILSGGRGGRLTAYRFDPTQAGFVRAAESPEALEADTSGMAAWTSAAGESLVLVAESAVEAQAGIGGFLQSWSLRDGALQKGDRLFVGPASPGPIAVADVDGDQDLDVFVGGRVVPGRYPDPASSHLFLNQNGKLERDTNVEPLFNRVGLAAGACWSDVNSDGWPDLVLACEWGPVRLWINERGRLREATREWQLEPWTGLWTGVAAGDFNGDGRLDLVAGNWGLNSPYRASTNHPLRIIHGDLDDNGTYEVIEAYDDPILGTVPRWDLDKLTAAWPILATRFASRRAYAQANLDQILGPERARASELCAVTLTSTLFLNQGNHFKPIPLPREAQFAPVFGVSVGDLDGDGHEDVFLSQNLLATPVDAPRFDAGRGLWLRGTGDGQFIPLRGQETGVAVYGEQRGCALADYDSDGRLDLVVTQNGAETRIFRNTAARPGLRVRLKGSRANPSALGAVVRVQSANRWGPARAVCGGGSYWSQDAATLLMATPAIPSRVEVRWPGGRTTTTEVPEGARQITLEESALSGDPGPEP